MLQKLTHFITITIVCLGFLFLKPYIFVDSSFLDSAEAWQLSFQDPASPVMEGIINLHHDLMFILIVILGLVMWILGRILFLYEEKKNEIPSKVVHGTFLELIWTITPSLILIIIAIPSFALLYSIDEVINPAITLKVVGHQWYWVYEYADVTDSFFAFVSYLIPEENLDEGQLRLLEVDNRVCLPVKTHIRIIVTSSDVLHCWAIPSLAMKLDACPGRLNQTNLFIKRSGLYFGQCSEICGRDKSLFIFFFLCNIVEWFFPK